VGEVKKKLVGRNAKPRGAMHLWGKLGVGCGQDVNEGKESNERETFMLMEPKKAEKHLKWTNGPDPGKSTRQRWGTNTFRKM